MNGGQNVWTVHGALAKKPKLNVPRTDRSLEAYLQDGLEERGQRPKKPSTPIILGGLPCRLCCVLHSGCRIRQGVQQIAGVPRQVVQVFAPMTADRSGWQEQERTLNMLPSLMT